MNSRPTYLSVCHLSIPSLSPIYILSYEHNIKHIAGLLSPQREEGWLYLPQEAVGDKV